MLANHSRLVLSLVFLSAGGVVATIADLYGPTPDPRAAQPLQPNQAAPTQEREIDVVPSQLRLGDDLKAIVSENLGNDPAEWTHFRVSLDRVSRRFDTRKDEELIQAIEAAKTPTLREQAVFEYADRHRKG